MLDERDFEGNVGKRGVAHLAVARDESFQERDHARGVDCRAMRHGRR